MKLMLVFFKDGYAYVTDFEARMTSVVTGHGEGGVEGRVESIYGGKATLIHNSGGLYWVNWKP